MDPRLAAVRILTKVVQSGQSLSAALPPVLAQVQNPADRALVQEICYGVLRWWHRLDAMANTLLERKLKPKDTDIKCLVLCGIYQIVYMRIPAHAAVAETVKQVSGLRKNWAKKLVNALLRSFQRRQEQIVGELENRPETLFSYPLWLLDSLRQDWPEDWQEIARGGNERPPMALRVNLAKTTREKYLQQLQQAGLEALPGPFNPDALVLAKPIDVSLLPSFEEGFASVQDVAAQQAARLLDLKPGQRVLDACAAPGGKSCHILEAEPGLDELLALDIDASRLARVSENLDRIGITARLVEADVMDIDKWWDGRQFDRILLDAPCSATGVIRRHPDIKLLRRAEDIDALVKVQEAMLERVWPLLIAGGMLLYATCSILCRENADQIDRFLTHHEDASSPAIESAWGRKQAVGKQLFPGDEGMDGFYYAVLRKT